MDKLYELWSLKDKDPVLIGSYSLMSDLIESWSDNQDEQPLTAKASVGDDEVVIDDLMPVKVMGTHLESAADWNQSIIDCAAYYTMVRFLGVGQYERHERLTRKEAVIVSQELANENKANYMIYAVNPLGNSTWVQNVTPEQGIR